MNKISPELLARAKYKAGTIDTKEMKEINFTFSYGQFD